MTTDSNETRIAVVGNDAGARTPLSAPQSTGGDHTHAALRALLGIIPWVGSAATEALNYIWQQPLSKRRDEFLESVATSLNELAERHELKAEDILDNPLFTTTLANATRQAAFTHQQEKLEALRNAVINSRDRFRFDETRTIIYLAMLDRYTTLHLKILLLAVTNNGLRHLSGAMREAQREEEARIETERRELARGLETSSVLNFDIVRPAIEQLGREGLISDIPSGGRLGAALMAILPTSLGLDVWKFFSDENVTTRTAQPTG